VLRGTPLTHSGAFCAVCRCWAWAHMTNLHDHRQRWGGSAVSTLAGGCRSAGCVAALRQTTWDRIDRPGWHRAGLWLHACGLFERTRCGKLSMAGSGRTALPCKRRQRSAVPAPTGNTWQHLATPGPKNTGVTPRPASPAKAAGGQRRSDARCPCGFRQGSLLLAAQPPHTRCCG